MITAAPSGEYIFEAVVGILDDFSLGEDLFSLAHII